MKTSNCHWLRQDCSLAHLCGKSTDLYWCFQNLPNVCHFTLISLGITFLSTSLKTLLSGLKMVIFVVSFSSLGHWGCFRVSFYWTYISKPQTQRRRRKENICFLWDFYRLMELELRVTYFWFDSVLLHCGEAQYHYWVSLITGPIKDLSKLITVTNREEWGLTKLPYSCLTQLGLALRPKWVFCLPFSPS